MAHFIDGFVLMRLATRLCILLKLWSNYGVFTELILEKVYEAIQQLQQVTTVRANIDTLAENDKTLSEFTNKVSKVVESTEQDIESPVGRANITVLDQQQQSPVNLDKITAGLR